MNKGNLWLAAIFGAALLYIAAEGGWFALGAIALMAACLAALLGTMAAIGWLVGR